jgi:hypothetical protein
MRRLLCLLPTLLWLEGCGTYVPNLQDFSADQAPGADILLVRAIVRSVHCELRNAVTAVIDQDKALAPLNNGFRNALWFDKWGVQVALTLTVDEKTTINPSSTWTPNPVAAVFSLAASANVSSDGKRIDTFNYFYTVKELYALKSCPKDDNARAPTGSLLIQGDLKTRSWLLSQIAVVGTGEATVATGVNTPLKQQALTHQVTFEVDSSGGINPAWRFSRVNIDQDGTLFAVSRNRTHDLILTFGPIDPTAKDKLASAASGAFFASQISTAINATRGNRL